MHGRVGKAAKFAAAVLLCLCIACCCLPAYAQRLNLKVGFFALDGYHEIAQDGTRSGYGYILLQTMARYANISYTYLAYDRSQPENMDMLENGEIDLLTAVRKSPELEERFDFSDYSIGSGSTILSIKAGNDTILRDDYESYQGMRVGYFLGGNYDEEVKNFAQKHGFSVECIGYNSYDEMEQALQDGMLDALVSSSFRIRNNEWILNKFNETPFYAVVRKGDAQTLALVNEALRSIEMEEPNWHMLLMENGNSAETTIPFFTPEEQGYLQAQNEQGRVFKVLAAPDRSPYSYVEDGQMMGIMPDLFSIIAKRAGIAYEWVLTSNRDEYAQRVLNRETDLCIDMTSDFYLAEKNGYCITDSYLSANFSWLRRSESTGDIERAVKRSYNLATPAQYSYDNAYHGIEYIEYSTHEECMEALLSGEVDGYCVYTYQAEQTLMNDLSDSLVSTISQATNEFAIGIPKEQDARLASILNKAVLTLKDWEVVDIIRQRTMLREPQFSLWKLLVSNPRVGSIAVLSISTAVLLSILVLQQLRYQKGLKGTIRMQRAKLNESMQGMLGVLATAIEFRSSESGDHVRRICHMTRDMMMELQKLYPSDYSFTKAQVEQIASASLLHDVGKIAIPDHILNKPGKLTDIEFATIKQHPLKGCELLERIPNLADESLYMYAYDICRWHHERWDGSGYPDGLAGDEIPIWAQVTAVADVYDALISPRVYKKAYSYEEARKMILNGECGTFNPQLLQAFENVAELYKPQGSVEEASEELYQHAPAGRDLTTLMLSAFQELLSNSPDIIFLKDVDLVYRAASPGFAAITSKGTPEKLISHTDFEIFDDQQLAQKFREDDHRLLLSGGGDEFINYPERIGHREGIDMYGSTSKHLLTDSQGRIMGILGFTRDITSQYYANLHHRKQLKNLLSLPQNVYFAVYLDVTAWCIIGENRHEVGGLAFKPHTTIETLSNLARLNIVDRRGSAYSFYEHFDSGSLQQLYENGRNDMTLEYIRRMSDGSMRWVRDELRFLVEPNNGHLCLMLTVYDIHAEKEAEKKMLERAERDGLTKLLDHEAITTLIKKELSSADSEHTTHALVMIDLDDFKRINDTFGHQIGDLCLKKQAENISRTFRSSDLMGRIGGDEFIVLMRQVTNRDAVENKVKTLLQSMEWFEGAGSTDRVKLSASIGISLFPDDATTFQQLYDKADQAMYHAKKQGKHQMVFFADIQSE